MKVSQQDNNFEMSNPKNRRVSFIEKYDEQEDTIFTYKNANQELEEKLTNMEKDIEDIKEAHLQETFDLNELINTKDKEIQK